MPPKTTSPEAALNKDRKAQIRELELRRRVIRKQFRDEQKRLIKASEAAHREVLKFQSRAEKQLPAQEADIDRRIAILKGRIGI